MNAACSSQPDCSSSARAGSHSGPLRRSTTKYVVNVGSFLVMAMNLAQTCWVCAVIG